MANILYYALLSSKAAPPTKHTPHSAGFDLFSAEERTLRSKGRTTIKTDLALQFPPGTYGRIAPVSTLSSQYGIETGAGVVDFDYVGNVGVILYNFSDEDYQIHVGDRIAQIICECIKYPTLRHVPRSHLVETLPSARGSRGMGNMKNE